MMVLERYDYVKVSASLAEWRRASEALPEGRIRERITNRISMAPRGAPDDYEQITEFAVEAGTGGLFVAELATAMQAQP